MIPGRTASHLSIQELLGSLIAYEGITTTDGDPGDITLVDSALIGSNDFITGKSVIILDGNAVREDKIASNFDALTGTITFPAMSSQILSGTPFIILNVANAGSSLVPIASDISSIKVVTDALPDGGSLTTLQGVVDGIKAVTDAIPDAGALSSLGDASGDSLTNIVAKLGDDTVPVKDRLNTLYAEVESTSLVTGAGSNADSTRLGALVRWIADNMGGGGGTGKIYMGITVAPGDTLTIGNDVLCIGDINVGAGSTLTIEGDCHATGSLDNSGNFTVYGDCRISGQVTIEDGISFVWGNCSTGSDFNVVLGVVTIEGDCKIAQVLRLTAGSLVINGECSACGGTVVVSATLIISGDFFTVNFTNNTGVTSFYGNCFMGSLNQADIGVIVINGNLECLSGGLNITDGGSLTVNGSCRVIADVVVGAGVSGSMTVNGYLAAVGAITKGVGATINYNKYIEYAP